MPIVCVAFVVLYEHSLEYRIAGNFIFVIMQALKAYFRGLIFIVCPEHVITVAYCPCGYYSNVQIFVGLLGLSVTKIKLKENVPVYVHYYYTDMIQSFYTCLSTCLVCIRVSAILLLTYVNCVPLGALYKSFLISPTTTTNDLIAMALDKAYLGEDHTPQRYTIWDRDQDTSSRSSKSSSHNDPLHAVYCLHGLTVHSLAKVKLC